MCKSLRKVVTRRFQVAKFFRISLWNCRVDFYKLFPLVLASANVWPRRCLLTWAKSSEYEHKATRLNSLSRELVWSCSLSKLIHCLVDPLKVPSADWRFTYFWNFIALYQVTHVWRQRLRGMSAYWLDWWQPTFILHKSKIWCLRCVNSCSTHRSHFKRSWSLLKEIEMGLADFNVWDFFRKPNL